jgi:plastocyanin
MRRRRIITLTALAIVLVAAVPSEGAFLVRATSTGNRFLPARADVAQGTRVTWRAIGGTHTVTAYGGGWSKDTRITAGTQTGFTFQQRGTFRYRCRLHSSVSGGQCSGMCGRVVVS